MSHIKSKVISEQPKRKEFAIERIESLGYKLTHEDDSEIRFMFKGNEIKFFPYTGWASGRGIKAGRGINNLLNQIS